MSSSTKFKAAVAQVASVAFDTPKTLAKLAKYATEASQSGAKLLVFPEAFIGGYPKGTTFDSYIGGRTPKGRDWFSKYHEGSIQIPGPEIEQLEQISKQLDIYLVVGVIEKDGGTLYCTIVFFDPKLGYLGKHRKVMPTAGERLIWGFGDGSTLPVYDTSIGKLGAVICWENYMPLLRASMFSKGIQLYCAPTADDRETWVASMQHIAKEGRCYVFSCCQFAKRKDYPIDYPTMIDQDPEAIYLKGGSCIINPMGELLVGPNFDKETILYADVDLNEIIRYKWDFDVIGHYSRPDLFNLKVNEAVHTSVKFVGGEIKQNHKTKETDKQKKDKKEEDVLIF